MGSANPGSRVARAVFGPYCQRQLHRQCSGIILAPFNEPNHLRGSGAYAVAANSMHGILHLGIYDDIMMCPMVDLIPQRAASHYPELILRKLNGIPAK